MSHYPIRRTATVWLLMAILASASLGLPSPAVARGKKRVVVLPFSGPRGGTARSGVIAAIKRRVRLIPPKRFNRAGGTADIAAACAKVKCDAVIKGQVKKRRRRFTVTVTVFNGGTGAAIGRRAAGVRGRRRVARAGAAIGRRCLPLIAKAKAGGGKPKPAPVAAAPPPAPSPTPTPGPAPTPTPPRQGGGAGTDTSDIPIYKPPAVAKDPEVDEEEEDEAETKVTRRSTATSPLSGLFDVSAAIGLAYRSATLTSDDTRTLPADDHGERQYDGSMYPEIVIRADVFPLVPVTKSFSRWFGIGATFAHHLSISTKTRDDQDVGTSSWELLTDLKYRWALWDTNTSPVIDVLAGFGLRTFGLDLNTTMASFNYRFLRFGLEGTVPILTPLLAGMVGFDVRPLLGVGEEAIQTYGSRSGGLAWAIRAGVSGRIQLGLFYFLTFEYLSHSVSFDGWAVTEPQNENESDEEYLQRLLGIPGLLRDGHPDRLDPTSTTDRFIRVFVGGGYAF